MEIAKIYTCPKILFAKAILNDVSNLLDNIPQYESYSACADHWFIDTFAAWLRKVLIFFSENSTSSYNVSKIEKLHFLKKSWDIYWVYFLSILSSMLGL